VHVDIVKGLTVNNS